MRTMYYVTVDRLKELEPEWNRLVLFQSAFQQYSWYALMVKDWKRSRLVYRLTHSVRFYVLSVNEKIECILPVSYCRFWGNAHVYGHQWSDYVDIVGGTDCSVEDLSWFLSSVLKSLHKKKLLAEFLPVDSRLISAEEPALHIEKRIMVGNGYGDEFGCYVLDRPESFDAYLQSQGKHFCKNYKWRMNKIQKNGLSCEVAVHRESDALADATDNLYRARKIVKNGKFNIFFLNVFHYLFISRFPDYQIVTDAKHLNEKGFLLTLHMNGELAAFGYALPSDGARTLYLLQTTFNPVYADYSPAVVMFTELIREWVEGVYADSAYEHFDFTRGAENYKKQLGATKRELYKVTIRK
ncbi:MAG: GNAT family N-acetyltransferase [Sphaerochaetaceae bacterium]|nr:GNAT family N-acetyltransferase [Sphaerochaetaceae bacterium]